MVRAWGIHRGAWKADGGVTVATTEDAGNTLITGLPPKRPGKSGSTSQVYLITFYLVVFSLSLIHI